MSINHVYMSGNIGAEPELKATQGGTPLLDFSVAVNDRIKDSQTGVYKDRPNWVMCRLWGNRATSLQKYLHKGTKVFIEGKLHQARWEKDGQKRSMLSVNVTDIEFVSNQQNQHPAQQQPTYSAPTQEPYIGDTDAPWS